MEQKPQSSARDNLGWLFGAMLIVLGSAALVGQFVPFNFSGIVWALIFAGGGAAFYLLSTRTPANRWALIPGYVLFAIGTLILLRTLNIQGELIGMFVMLAIAFPFLVVYSRNPRRNWWALIPAYTMTAIAGLIALGAAFRESPIVPTYVMFAIALPFYYVYFRNRANWWALIPAGIMTFIGLGIFMVSVQYILPIALIGLGVAMLIRQFARKEPAAVPLVPKTGPQADKPPSV
jgi:hypothetical protein